MQTIKALNLQEGMPGAAVRSAPDSEGDQSASNLNYAEGLFLELLSTDDLDQNLAGHSGITSAFERKLSEALNAAYHESEADPAAHLFLQRILYRINRMKLFWYDDLANYSNERSNYMRNIRDRIEGEWQQWEMAVINVPELKRENITEALTTRTTYDLDPPISADGVYFRDQVGIAGYRRLLQIASLDGLVEASQLSRTLGGASNRVHSVLTRLLLEEYGGGNTSRKHSSYFKLMLDDLHMDPTPEGYLESVPWEVLAVVNLSFLFSERKRYFLRYIGGLLYTEISVPAAFKNYRAAAARLGLAGEAMAYWDLHIKEDERHGRWMLQDIALPLAGQYGDYAWELLLGYELQRLMSIRAGSGITRAARNAERESGAGVRALEHCQQ